MGCFPASSCPLTVPGTVIPDGIVCGWFVARQIEIITRVEGQVITTCQFYESSPYLQLLWLVQGGKREQYYPFKAKDLSVN